MEIVLASAHPRRIKQQLWRCGAPPSLGARIITHTPCNGPREAPSSQSWPSCLDGRSWYNTWDKGTAADRHARRWFASGPRSVHDATSSQRHDSARRRGVRRTRLGIACRLHAPFEACPELGTLPGLIISYANPGFAEHHRPTALGIG